MGRQKIKIELLPESQIKAKFKKRKSGVVKKASELGTLCGAQIALIIFSKDGEEVIDKAYNGTTLEIIERYWSQVHGREHGEQSARPRQQRTAAASQVLNQQFQPNSDSSIEGQYTNPQPQVQQAQQDQFMNPQMQQDQFMNPQVQQDQCMNPQAQQDQYINPQVQLVQIDPRMQQDQYMNLNPQLQQGVPMSDPGMQQGQYINPHLLQEVPTDPLMQQGTQYVNPHGQQSMTGISQMQQGMQYNRGTNFVDSSNYMQNMEGGNQQLHIQGHQTQFTNQTNVGYNGQPSDLGFQN